MKFIWWGLLVLLSLNTAQAFATTNQFTCTDSDGGAFASEVPGKTHFEWDKNGQKVFDRTFTDTYSASRNSYVSFYCRSNIIRYQLFSCEDPSIKPLCQPKTDDFKVTVDYVRVPTSPTLLDGSDYQFITHYLVSASKEGGQIKGAYFVNDLDGVPKTVTTEEAAAATEYLYILMGPENEIFTGIETDDGRLYFDLSSGPIPFGTTPINFGIAAKPKPTSAGPNTRIRFRLNPHLSSTGLNLVRNDGRTEIPASQVALSPTLPATFTRSRSALEVKHFKPQVVLKDPSLSLQPLYRFQVRNMSELHQAELKRATVDVRVIGLQRVGGADLQPNDFAAREINETAQPLGGSLGAQLTLLPDSRSNHQSATVQLNFNNFILNPGQTRRFEIQVANLENDIKNKGDDDGMAAQPRPENLRNGDPRLLEALADAAWVWSDLSGPSVAESSRQNWRSGANIDMDRAAVIIYD